MTRLNKFCRLRALNELIVMFSTVNQDSAETKGCPVVALTDWDFYAEQIHNLHENGLSYGDAETLAKEMAERLLVFCDNCRSEAAGNCPRCFRATGLGCPHGELCGDCKAERDGE